MAKNKSKKQPNKGRRQQTQSFEQYMLAQTMSKFKGYIDAEVNAAAQQIANQQKSLLENMYVRIRTLEEIIIEKFDDIDKTNMAKRIAVIEDKAIGLEVVDQVKEGDRVRVEIATKAKDQEEFQGKSKMMIDQVGSGRTLGKELEGALLDMKTDEVRELDFGKDKTMVAQLTVNRISRDLKAEKEKADAAAKEADSKVDVVKNKEDDHVDTHAG